MGNTNGSNPSRAFMSSGTILAYNLRTHGPLAPHVLVFKYLDEFVT